jgi:hypothetical protein
MQNCLFKASLVELSGTAPAWLLIAYLEDFEYVCYVTLPLPKGPLEAYLDLGLCVVSGSPISKTRVGFSGSPGAYPSRR